MKKIFILSDSEVTYTPETKKDKMCTVYFPADCKNDCKFCTSKIFYEQNKPNQKKVLKWLQALADSLVSEIVITGGEPMSDLALLKEILTICKNKTVYINTTFLDNDKEEFIKLVNSFHNVKGINISRHTKSYKLDSVILRGIAKDEEILKIKTNVRINCFVGEKIEKDKMKQILNRWEPIWEQKKDHKLDISFRHDYNKVVPENLHLLETESIKAATEVGNYYGRVYCHACDKVLFKTKKGMDFRIHRGLPNTRVKIGNIIEMQELVLFPDGKLCTDWDKTQDGLEYYLKLLNIKKH
jgi:organic radical activating enzyme